MSHLIDQVFGQYYKKYGIYTLLKYSSTHIKYVVKPLFKQIVENHAGSYI